MSSCTIFFGRNKLIRQKVEKFVLKSQFFKNCFKQSIATFACIIQLTKLQRNTVANDVLRLCLKNIFPLIRHFCSGFERIKNFHYFLKKLGDKNHVTRDIFHILHFLKNGLDAELKSVYELLHNIFR